MSQGSIASTKNHVQERPHVRFSSSISIFFASITTDHHVETPSQWPIPWFVAVRTHQINRPKSLKRGASDDPKARHRRQNYDAHAREPPRATAGPAENATTARASGSRPRSPDFAKTVASARGTRKHLSRPRGRRRHPPCPAAAAPCIVDPRSRSADRSNAEETSPARRTRRWCCEPKERTPHHTPRRRGPPASIAATRRSSST